MLFVAKQRVTWRVAQIFWGKQNTEIFFGGALNVSILLWGLKMFPGPCVWALGLSSLRRLSDAWASLRFGSSYLEETSEKFAPRGSTASQLLETESIFFPRIGSPFRFFVFCFLGSLGFPLARPNRLFVAGVLIPA